MFERFREQRRLNLRRLIRFGFDGPNSQMNGMCLRQSNIFHDRDAVIATQPSLVSPLGYFGAQALKRKHFIGMSNESMKLPLRLNSFKPMNACRIGTFTESIAFPSALSVGVLSVTMAILFTSKICCCISVDKKLVRASFSICAK